jgi:glutaredoxin
MKDIKVYGADWCPGTQNALAHLKQMGVPFRYIDVEQDTEASEWVKAQNGGKERKPTIDVDGRILIEPSDRELESALA